MAVRRWTIRLTLLGIGAMKSPRYAPAGLLVACRGRQVMLDGGPGMAVPERLDAWLVSDDRCELIRELRSLARARGLEPRVAALVTPHFSLTPLPVVHTSHPTFGFRLRSGRTKAVWAPEFFEFPAWARNADLMFADGAGWDRPIRFARKAGGHAAAVSVAAEARRHNVRRLVIAHIGRPTIRAMDAGQRLPFGEFGVQGKSYRLRVETS
jgi:hypothetical protein